MLSPWAGSPFAMLDGRRSLLERLSAGGDQPAVGLVVVDVDRFRELNATHGRGVGDSVLAGLTDILVTGTRREDTVARLGAATYAVVVTPSDERRVRGLADRLRREVDAYSWWRLSPGLAVTVNDGVAWGPRIARLTTSVVVQRANLAGEQGR